jgi:hypothetical protein
MKTIPMAVAALTTLGACTQDPGFSPPAGVREATAAEVTDCAYVSDIRMKPGVYGPLADQGLKYARNSVMADARDAGANRVVFNQVTPGADVYAVAATAYRC